MYYLSMFAFESVGVKLPNCISDGWQPPGKHPSCGCWAQEWASVFSACTLASVGSNEKSERVLWGLGRSRVDLGMVPVGS